MYRGSNHSRVHIFMPGHASAARLKQMTLSRTWQVTKAKAALWCGFIISDVDPGQHWFVARDQRRLDHHDVCKSCLNSYYAAAAREETKVAELAKEEAESETFFDGYEDSTSYHESRMKIASDTIYKKHPTRFDIEQAFIQSHPNCEHIEMNKAQRTILALQAEAGSVHLVEVALDVVSPRSSSPPYSKHEENRTFTYKASTPLAIDSIVVVEHKGSYEVARVTHLHETVDLTLPFELKWVVTDISEAMNALEEMRKANKTAVQQLSNAAALRSALRDAHESGVNLESLGLSPVPITVATQLEADSEAASEAASDADSDAKA